MNMSGGAGKNVEADLVQEHSVRNRKDLIRHLGANKTEKAMVRSTGAADTIAHLTSRVDEALGIRTAGSRHTYHISEEDSAKVIQQV